ncbi:family 3 glycosyl hydrolase [Enemella evansiae]|nr:family 3 glycosyl hydrolase [Enemella evansiae]
MPMPTIDELIARLDLNQKVRLLTGSAAFSLAPEPAIDLARVDISDGPTGVRGLKFIGGDRVVLFPSATVLASAWDEELIEEVGRVVADEAERQQIATVLGPTINLHRTPLGGRLFEQYSEDPLLTGRIAAGYVRGIQQQGIGACLKHLAANEAETERNTVDSVLDERTLREVYLLPFEIAIAEDPWMVMASYNKVNGTTATENAQLLRGVLRDDWDWNGVVVSDWYATRTTVESAAGGLDLVMPGPHGPWGDALVAAVREGRLAESVIDEKVRRVLAHADRAGLLGRERTWRDGIPAPDSPERVAQLTGFAAAGFTLLKNDGVLPLEPGTRVAAIGRPVVQTVGMGGGSATVNAPYQRSIAEGLTGVSDRLGSLVVVDGVEVRDRAVTAGPGTLIDPVTGTEGVRARYFDAAGELLAEVHSDVASVSVGFDDDLPRPATAVELRGVLTRGGLLEVGALGSGAWQLLVGDQRSELILSISGHDPGEAMLKPPSRSTPMQVAAGTEIVARVDITGGAGTASSADNAELDALNASGAGPKGIVAGPAARPVEEVIAEAVAAARTADVAIVGVGLTEEQETEAVDKSTLALPGEQDRLVREVAAVAPRTVVVVNASTPVLMPWEDEVDAVLVVGLPGQEGGLAIARVLLGELEPAGRLVTTWPVADGATPAWEVVPENGRLVYREGTFVGHRGHQPYGLAPRPAHWFGEGLGWGDFSYGEPELGTDADGRHVVSVEVRNAADRASREVVQVYLRPSDPAEPVRLVGFAAARIPAGEQARVEVVCDPRLWRSWDEQANRWAELAPGGELLVARGLGDVRGRVRLDAPISG